MQCNAAACIEASPVCGAQKVVLPLWTSGCHAAGKQEMGRFVLFGLLKWEIFTRVTSPKGLYFAPDRAMALALSASMKGSGRPSTSHGCKYACPTQMIELPQHNLLVFPSWQLAKPHQPASKIWVYRFAICEDVCQDCRVQKWLGGDPYCGNSQDIFERIHFF